MAARSNAQYILLYLPPCGRWYVHSHKIYPSPEAARAAAKKFLHPDVVISVAIIDLSCHDEDCIAVRQIP